MGKEKPQLETRKLQMGTLTSKGERTVQAGNRLHTNLIQNKHSGEEESTNA